jgi:hypothetical protein
VIIIISTSVHYNKGLELAALTGGLLNLGFLSEEASLKSEDKREASSQCLSGRPLCT